MMQEYINEDMLKKSYNVLLKWDDYTKKYENY